MIRALLSLFFLATLLMSGVSHAESALEKLVIERAQAEYGHLFPSGGDMSLTQASHDMPDAIMIAEFWMDDRTGRFLANVLSERGGIQRVQGLLQVLVPVPVPVRRLMPGERIAPTDIEIVDLPASALNAFAVTDPGQIVGQEVKRMLVEGRPVMAQSVMQPYAVDRGSKVTIAYLSGPLRLLAPGRALGDATEGDEVRVVNLSSNQTVSAIARGNGFVEVLK